VINPRLLNVISMFSGKPFSPTMAKHRRFSSVSAAGARRYLYELHVVKTINLCFQSLKTFNSSIDFEGCFDKHAANKDFSTIKTDCNKIFDLDLHSTFVHALR
jgi:hypothetical protein